MSPPHAGDRDGQSEPSRTKRIRDTLALAAAFPLGVYIISVLHQVPASSPGIYYRPFFILQYANGIYRYRVLGRELVIGVSNLINLLEGGPRITGLSAATRSVEASMYTAYVLVNGVSLLAFSILLYVVTVRTREWLVPYVILVTMTVLSGYVLTPYDFLSYLFIAAALIVALSGRRWAWAWCIPLAVLGTATRESFLVVVAALVATRVSEPGSVRHLRLVPARDDRLWQSTESIAVGAVVTYVLLRVVLSRGTDASTFFQSVPGTSNVNWASLVAMVIVVLGAFAFATQIPRVDDLDRQRSSRRRRALVLLWIFSAPYLVVSAIGGIWSEALRLVLPVAICHYVVCWHLSRPDVTGPPVVARRGSGLTAPEA